MLILCQKNYWCVSIFIDETLYLQQSRNSIVLLPFNEFISIIGRMITIRKKTQISASFSLKINSEHLQVMCTWVSIVSCLTLCTWVSIVSCLTLPQVLCTLKRQCSYLLHINTSTIRKSLRLMNANRKVKARNNLSNGVVA